MVELKGFYKLSVEERLKLLEREKLLSNQSVQLLKNGNALKIEVADRMVENVIGTIQLPIGIATNFKINGKDYQVPMAIEEASVIAAASKAAKLCLPEGFTAEADEPVMMGHVQLMNISNVGNALSNLSKHRNEIIAIARESSKVMEQYGGGFREVVFKELKNARTGTIIAEFYVDVRDAMGANTVNTILEQVAPMLSEITGGKTRLRIISNLAIRRKVRAKAIWKKEVIGEDGVEGVLDGYDFAKNDVYRCATHNKGVMNGIDAVAIATGNDWRAVEAGMHSFASLNGYHPITKYEKDKNGNLVGTIELPLPVATVGGAINTLPHAKVALELLGAKSAKELAMAMVCVGLANNFAALLALSTVGIQEGHMKLHSRNLAVIAGAKTDKEITCVSDKMNEEKKFSVDYAKKLLEEMR
ncbi:MAG: hydroxymethylglutaryl-CoA reductase, degradative [Candidatus Micrarchaeota archaeon]